jgi:serine/threonine protein kinase
MHKFKFLHQDIKPENIMYSSILNNFVFIDFGLSKIV